MLITKKAVNYVDFEVSTLVCTFNKKGVLIVRKDIIALASVLPLSILKTLLINKDKNAQL